MPKDAKLINGNTGIQENIECGWKINRGLCLRSQALVLAMSLMFWTLIRIINSFGPLFPYIRGFAGSSDGKESAYIVGDLGSDPWIGKIPWRREWLPDPVFLPGDPMDRGAQWAIVHGVTQNQTRLSN